MGVGADDEIAAGQVPAFRHHLVTDTVADIVEHRAMFFRERAHVAMHIGRFDIGRRGVMIEHNGRF